jgi:hypothetical protein
MIVNFFFVEVEIKFVGAHLKLVNQGPSYEPDRH